MLFHAYSDLEWLYPDTPFEACSEPCDADAARGGTAGIQLLTDAVLESSTPVHYSFDAPSAISCNLYQLLPTHVEANSGRDAFTAESYEDVQDFVTRRAPFDVYDITRPLDDGKLRPGKLAFYLRLFADSSVLPGDYLCVLTLTAGTHQLSFPLTLHVHACVIPPLSETKFGMVDWLSLDDIAQMHRVSRPGDAFWELVGRYLDAQLDLRINHLMLPGGRPVRDVEGTIVDFDFSDCERLGEMALERGFSYIYGGFVAHWSEWDNPYLHVLWDDATDVTGFEGYRELSLYFKKLWQIVKTHGWESRWMQCLVDEPQFASSENYRTLAGICRRHMPGVRIHDPVESTELGGAVDIWCVKQALYEKRCSDFRALQDLGEEMWVYTCGFPAGCTMNRSTDLPLAATRLPFWMCAKYGFTGFLHWGYNAYSGRDPFLYNCYGRGQGRALPPGDGFIVYPGDDGTVWNSLRAQHQRSGAEDYEVLMQLPREERMSFIDRACRSFDDYETDPALLSSLRRELLRAF